MAKKHAFSKEEAKIILRFLHLLREMYRWKSKITWLQMIAGLEDATQCNVFKLDWTDEEGE